MRAASLLCLGFILVAALPMWQTGELMPFTTSKVLQQQEEIVAEGCGDDIDVSTSYAKIMEGQQKFDFHPVPINLGTSNVKCVIYTAVIGHYEVTVKPFPKQTRQCHWIALTDRKDLKPTAKWQIRQIPRALTALKYRSSKHRGYVITKYIKMLPFLLFPPSIQIAIYIDATYTVTNSTFVERAVNSVIGAKGNHPIFFRPHLIMSKTIEEILYTMVRYTKVGTANLIATQYLAHVAEGMCDNWFDAPRGGAPRASVENAPQAIQATFDQAKQLIQFMMSCNMTEASLSRATQKLFHNDTTPSTRTLRCNWSPPKESTLPRFNASLLLGMPYPSGPMVPMYDASMIAFRLHHPNVSVRAFGEAFLKQWFIDSVVHGKDQLPLILLLWRTPGYHPAILGSEFRRFGGPMLFRNYHGK